MKELAAGLLLVGGAWLLLDSAWQSWRSGRFRDRHGVILTPQTHPVKFPMTVGLFVVMGAFCLLLGILMCLGWAK